MHQLVDEQGNGARRVATSWCLQSQHAVLLSMRGQRSCEELEALSEQVQQGLCGEVWQRVRAQRSGERCWAQRGAAGSGARHSAFPGARGWRPPNRLCVCQCSFFVAILFPSP
eukprot:scaffold78124_cov19-Tisochrysis_lutea.AAC.3